MAAQGIAPRQKKAGPLINVGVLIRYGDSSINQGRFRWPPTITEEDALRLVFNGLTDQDLQEVTDISFSQTPRIGCPRIKWIDNDAVGGKYRVNQHVYGDSAIATENSRLASQPMEYCADMDNVEYIGSLADCRDRDTEFPSTRDQALQNYGQPLGPRPQFM